jgi:hypothetical protein
MSNNLVVFKSISDFISSLNECFGKEQKTLQLYARLISRTTISHQDAIEKHISIVKKFLNENKEQILNKDIKFTTFKFSYNERVYVNLDPIFKKADKSETDVIFAHLLKIFSQVDPESNAKSILRETMKSNKQSGDDNAEENFINNLIENVSKNVNEDDDPLKAVSNIMQSGLLTDLIGGMSNGINNGELDLGRLMGTVQTMVTSLSNAEGDMNIPPMGGMNSPGGGNVDLGNMMNQMVGMMSQMNMQAGGMPGGMSNGMPNGMPNMAGGMPSGMPSGMTEGVPSVKSSHSEVVNIEEVTSEDGDDKSPVGQTDSSEESLSPPREISEEGCLMEESKPKTKSSSKKTGIRREKRNVVD